jgi:membrane protein required for colicin V production
VAAVDLFFVGVMLLSVLVGAWRGLVYEMLSVLSWVAAFMLAQWFALDAAAWLPMQGAKEPIRFAAGFLVVMVVALFAGALVALLIKKLVSAIGLRPVDRLLGAFFGAARALVLLLAITWVVGLTPWQHSETWQQGSGPQWGKAVLKGLQPMMPEAYGRHVPG